MPRSNSMSFKEFLRPVTVVFVCALLMVGTVPAVVAEANGSDPYVPPIPAPPPSPDPPELPPVPPVSPPALPAFPVPSPVPVPPGLPLPPILPSPPSLPSIPVLPSPSPTPGAVPFLSVWTEGASTPINSGLRVIPATANITELTWFSANAVACESVGFDSANTLAGSLISPHQDLSLAPGVSKSFALRCRNTVGAWSGWREVVIIKESAPATPANTAPEAPIIRGADISTSPADTAPTSLAVPFTVRATDADGDKLRYHFDWDRDGSTDQVSDYVPSGTTESVTYIWSVTGTYTFAVRAEDESGRYSPISTHTITIVEPVPSAPRAPLVALSLNKSLVRSGDFAVAVLTVAADYEVTCTLYGVAPGQATISYPGGIGQQSYSRVTAPLTATQVVRAVCVPHTPGFTLMNETREEKVYVVPAIEEV